MYKILTLNNISLVGLDQFSRNKYEVASEIVHPDAVVVRSFDMHKMELPATLKAIARAGAGVNNIPVDKCTERGIVVFNTPGANANSVKELVLTGMLISSRKIVQGINWAKSLIGKGDEVTKLIEKGKSNFEGPELKGKKLGVIGLGAIGVMVANSAVSLGMQVSGYDPYISVESAWYLSTRVKRAKVLESLLADSDYISIHVPLVDSTRAMINKERFAIMKKGMRLLNFSRNGIVHNEDLKAALADGTIAVYVTDFPDEELLRLDNVVGLPHLGASTPEAEDNCASMAVSQLIDFLEYGNIKNAVNFPECELPPSGKRRLLVANRNVPSMVGQIATILAQEKINIADMINKHRSDIAYNIIDIDSDLTGEHIRKINTIDGVIMVRII